MIPSPPREECQPGLPTEFEELRSKLRKATNDPYDGSLTTAFLGLIEACQQADRQAAQQQECCEFSDANLRRSELFQARVHLASAGREILTACRIALPSPVPLPSGLPGR